MVARQCTELPSDGEQNAATCRANFSAQEQKWPHFWGHVSRGYEWWAMSGKAMQDAVPPAERHFGK